MLDRPNGAEKVKRQLTRHGTLGQAEVPQAWPSWAAFWGAQEAGARR
jgi:hypothetical protein